ncbi:MAG TPA: hypothetical protein VG204_17185 [Terriglobia bacterium]|nr:hypothetical protein [Terriglobia bacterium]
MAEGNSGGSLSIARLVFVPALITLALTLLRLEGELHHWSAAWFSTAPGGPGPLAALMELLAPVFGIYFALKLARAGEGPSNARQAIGLAVLGAAMLLIGYAISFGLNIEFSGRLLLGYVVVAFGAVLQVPGWSRFVKTLLAYGLAARIPVVIVMYLALRGHWGTHFDNASALYSHMAFWPMFFYFSVLPQLVFWVVFTVITGCLLGTIAAAFVDRGVPATAP